MSVSPHQFDIQAGGYYGPQQGFGGQYIPEILIPALQELEEAFNKYKNDPDFLAELKYYRENWIGRPSPLIYAKNLSEQLGGAQIYLKNEGANLTGSHKINHCLYQVLLAKRMGKTKVICETGAGQHGLAVATVCAKFGLECRVHMGTIDIAKQYPNVFFMKQMEATIMPVDKGTKVLTDAVDAAMGDWISNPEAFYMLGSALGPHPYPEMNREAQKIVGQEISTQLQTQTNRQFPDIIIACMSGGSNAIGAFNEFLYNENVKLIGVEAGGRGVEKLGEHASKFSSKEGILGILEGFKSYFLLTESGQTKAIHSISAGLDYVGIGPLLAYLYSIQRLEVAAATDTEALEAFQILAKTEGLIVAIESSHAISEGLKQAKKLSKGQIIVINLSGRGDNYLFNIAKGLQEKDFQKFCLKYAEGF